QQILATCSRGTFDLGRRLVRYGWADPAETAPADIVELAAIARDKKIGKWQSEWLTDLPETALDSAPGPLPGLEELEPEIVEWSLRADPADFSEQQPVGAGTAVPVR
ncbi:MAG: hypothetical protein ABJN42_06735, partial [Roseibium sp.]